MPAKTSNTNRKTVAVGLSGGVDSSVAALLLKKQGYEVTGVYLKCYEKDAPGCASDEDRVSAVTTCSQLGINFTYLNYTKEYKKSVIDRFFAEYKKGNTPNPDIICNTDIKFGLFLDWALQQGYEHIATGHYARVNNNHWVKLLRGCDTSKDQSYFLYRLTQHQLGSTLFPLGDLTKSQVREMAQKAGLKTYNRPDSQGICFIGEVDIKEFLSERLPLKKGKVVHVNGQEVGTHDGVWYYTIGQRHGFTVREYFGLPLYVVDKDVKKNILVVGYAGDALRGEFEVSDLHWISGEEPLALAKTGKYSCETRLRHLGKIYKAKLTKVDNGEVKVELTEPSFGVAPGQSAVFYKGEEVLGGGVIL